MPFILGAFVLAIVIVVVVLADLLKAPEGVSTSDLARRTTVAGMAVIFSGVALRLGANWLAWPSQFSYSGPRESTSWAIREAGYQDLSVALLALGVGLLLLAAQHTLAMSREQSAARGAEAETR